MQPVSILHCGDVHLGFEFRGLGHQISAQRTKDSKRTFTEIINLCNTQTIDLLLIAGDLFEDWAKASQGYDFVYQSFDQLTHTTVAIAGGNHDPMTPESLYRTRPWPDHVIRMSSRYQSVLLPELKVELWGVSFSAPYHRESLWSGANRKAAQRPDFIQIGMLHGELDRPESAYHPISSRDIAASGLDYLALGHIHKPSPLTKAGDTMYAYCGSPEGLGFDEIGPRGVYYGRVGKGSTSMEFLPLCQRMYLEESINITQASTAHAMAEIVRETLHQRYGEQAPQHLYRVHLTGSLKETTEVSLSTVESLLSEFFYMYIQDDTTLAVALEELSREPTLKGLYAQKLLEKQGESSPEVFALAKKLGLKAFYGEVDYHDS